MKMPKTYKISAENAIEIEEIRKTITDKKSGQTPTRSTASRRRIDESRNS